AVRIAPGELDLEEPQAPLVFVGWDEIERRQVFPPNAVELLLRRQGANVSTLFDLDIRETGVLQRGHDPADRRQPLAIDLYECGARFLQNSAAARGPCGSSDGDCT